MKESINKKKKKGKQLNDHYVDKIHGKSKVFDEFAE